MLLYLAFILFDTVSWHWS